MLDKLLELDRLLYRQTKPWLTHNSTLPATEQCRQNDKIVPPSCADLPAWPSQHHQPPPAGRCQWLQHCSHEMMYCCAAVIVVIEYSINDNKWKYQRPFFVFCIAVTMCRVLYAHRSYARSERKPYVAYAYVKKEFENFDSFTSFAIVNSGGPVHPS